MKTLWRLTGAILLTALAAAGLAAHQTSQSLLHSDGLRVPLTFHPFTDPEQMVSFVGWGRADWLGAYRTIPSGYTAPQRVYKATFTVLRLPGTRKYPAAVLAQSAKSAKGYDKLWIDWNNDRKFTDDEALSGTVRNRYVAFGPIRRPGTDGAAPEFCVVTEGGRYCHTVPSGYYEGQATLGERAVKLALVDSNLNGYLDDRMIGYMPGDTLLIDQNADGAFAFGRPEGWDAFDEREAQPFTSLVQMPDGVLYKLTVAEDGSEALLERDARPTATIKVGASEFKITLLSEGGLVPVRGTNGQVAIPAGSYILQTVSLRERDQSGKLWTAQIYSADYYEGSGERLRVKPGQTTDLNVGGPFKLELRVSESKGRQSFSLGVVDKADHSVSGVTTGKGSYPPEPVLKITDANGKLVKTQKFHYG